MTNKMNHDDCIGHIASNFFHCYAVISLLAKVMGLQSILLSDKMEDSNAWTLFLGIKITFSIFAVIILVMKLIMFIFRSLKLMFFWQIKNCFVFLVYPETIYSMGTL